MRGLLVRSGAVLAMMTAYGCSSTPEPGEGPPAQTGACADGVRGGDELGTDCGGACKACDSAACTGPSDCASGRCEGGTCAASATKTCGTGTPAPCAVNEGCQTDLDCASDYCGDGSRCAAPGPAAFADGRRNAGETDIDCGGASGKACAAGGKCKVAGDCVGACNAGTCGPVGDADGKKNNGETDVDCGGPNAKKCAVGKACALGPDCGLGFCPASVCVAPTATDNIQNGTESDIDCGGAAQTFEGVTVPASPKCALTKKCAADGDCDTSVCADSKRCIEAPSCRPIHGGTTCGTGEHGVAGAAHESCCKTLPVPGAIPITQGGVEKQVYLDKYEITAGRIRTWVNAIKAQYGGVPNIRAWVKARMATDPILAAMFPGDKSDYLPSQLMSENKVISDPDATLETDISLLSQLGPTSYVRGVLANGGTSGCAMNSVTDNQKYGHRTYWFDATEAAYFSEVARPATSTKDLLDEKSMNCITPLMFTAFCAWDGGYLQSVDALSKAYGPDKWPWGALPEVNDGVAKVSNWNQGTGGFDGTKNPRYLWPLVNYGTFNADFSPIIAAPGRFPTDVSQVRAAADTWMDLGGNMIEWSMGSTAAGLPTGLWKGWTGASFEGHLYPRAWVGNIQYLDKYGKGGARCMRLR